MSATFSLLLNLLSPQKTTEISISDQEWNALFILAKEQAVAGIIWGVIEKLPKEQRPPKDILLAWMMLATRIQNMNELLNLRTQDLFAIYESLGVRPILLKGQGIATYYSNPSLRSCGDIDVLFWNEEECRIADKWAYENGSNIDDFSEKHLEFSWKGVNIENHRILDIFFSKKLHRRWLAIIKSEFLSSGYNTFPKVIIEGKEITTLPVTLNALFLFRHITHHLIGGGIGLRQIYDLYLFLLYHKNDIDKKKFSSWIKDLEMEKAISAIAAIMIDYWDIPKKSLPFKFVRNFKLEKIVLEDILSGGNFGQKRFKYKGKVSYLEQKTRSFIIHIQQNLRYYPFAPSETRANYGVFIKRGIKRLHIDKSCFNSRNS